MEQHVPVTSVVESATSFTDSSSEDREKIRLLEIQNAKLKSEKFKLASENLAQAEELEKLRQQLNQDDRLKSTSHDDEKELQEILTQTKAMVEQRENQLLKLINMNHVLTAQVNFLASRIHEAFDLSTYTPRASLMAEDEAKAREEERERLDVEVLKSLVHTLEGSQQGTRGELRAALKEYAAAELRISEQQATIESLEDNMSRFREDLENASGSAGALKEQIKLKDGEVAEYKQLILSIQKKLKEKEKDYVILENENRALKENLSASEAARCDLTKVCSEHIRNAKSEAQENFKELSERLLLEREEVLSNLSIVCDLERDVRNAVSKEAKMELHQLREELFNIHEREVQKNQEIEYLQQQLIKAAERIANMELDKKAFTR